MPDYSKGPIHPVPPAQPNKGKEPILMGESDPLENDELSFGSSPLLARSPLQNKAKAESKKRPLRQSNRSFSGAYQQILREASRDRCHLELAPKYMPIRLGGMAPSCPPVHHPFGVASASHLVSFLAIQGPADMLSSSIGLHILSY